MTSPITPSVLPTLPPAPDPQTPANVFDAAAFDFTTAQSPWADALQTLATETHTNAISANEAATTATTQAGIATTQAGIATTQAGIATTAAASAINSPATNATSSTSLTIGNGVKTFTIQTGKDFAVGQTVVLASSATPLNQMVGIVTAHNKLTGAMEVTVQSDMFGGSGTYSDWVVALTAAVYATTQIISQAAVIAALPATDAAYLFLLSFAKKG